MEIPESIKNELFVCQQKLRGAVGLHQKLHGKLKANPKDKRELKEKLINAQKMIKVIAKQQKPLVQRVRRDLDEYHEQLKKQNLPVDYEADTAFIAQQLEEHRNQKNKNKSLLLPRMRTTARSSTSTSASSSEPRPSKPAIVTKTETKPAQPKDKREEKPKSNVLLERRSKLMSALNKVCKQNAIPTSTVTNAGRPSISSTIVDSPPVVLASDIKQEEMPTEVSPRVSRVETPSPIPEYGPDNYQEPEIPEQTLEPGSKEQFLRYLGIVTHEQCSQLVARRQERKKRICVSTAKTDFLYSSPEYTPKRTKKLYLQQHTPPTTRRRVNEISNSDVIENGVNNCYSKSGGKSPNNSTIDRKSPFRLIEQLVVREKSASPEVTKIKIEQADRDEICIVCRHADEEAINRCEHCGEFYHPSCHGPGPLYVQSRLCPYCARRSSSPETIKDKLRIKREQRNKLLEKNINLNYEIQDLDLHASELTLKIKRQSFKHDQLLNDQRVIKNNLKTLLDFVAQAKGKFSEKIS